MHIKHLTLAFTLSLSLFWLRPAFSVTGLPEAIPEELLEAANSSYIFVFDDNVGAGQIRGQARRLTKQAGGELRLVFTKAIKGFSASVSATAAAHIGASPNIAYYEPNLIYWATDMKNRSDADERGRAASPGKGPGRDDDDDDDEEPAEVTPWGIDRVGGPVDGTGLHAWIIDSGIDLDHPDLNVDVNLSANFVDIGRDDSP
ncbi:MAG: hypothetical protein ABFR65_04840, partial [Pseudomonadota bacterium]